ncbi:hypothetical protein CRG98_001980 [Punica granatum]|uniref:Uncharacterized protein n=1 Tax=Punica granatum TaxID=22663 RepID=A0A2I0LAD2_PUNGR|nr:hypothetical protein CRG98_001980 [Punica granatum]
MPTLHSASHSKAQCGIVRLNCTTHLGLPSSALKVRIVLSSEQYTCHCSYVQELGDTRACLSARARTISCSCSAAPARIPAPVAMRSCARAPWKFLPCMHAHAWMSTSRTFADDQLACPCSSPARACLRVQLCA